MTIQANEKSKSKNGETKAKAQDEAETSKSAGTTPGSVDTKSLWAGIRGIEGESAQLQQKMDALVVKKSELLAQVVKNIGTGPFQIAGLGLVTIRNRKSKVEGKPDTYFFVSIGQKNVTVVE